MYYSQGKSIKNDGTELRKRLINTHANEEAIEMQYVSLAPPHVDPSTSHETTPLITKTRLMPMNIDEVESQTVRKPNKLKTHLQSNQGKYAIGAGIGGGIGAGVATMLHAGGQALADHVKDVKKQEYEENREDTFGKAGSISTRLATQLYKANAISKEKYDSIIFSNKFVDVNTPSSFNTADREDDMHIAQQSADARAKIVKDYITYIDPIHTGWIRDYPHMGPGNDILPAALNELDDIARKHDIAYHKAKTWNDIYKADQDFIYWIGHYTPDKWKDFAVKHIGKLGIQIKHSVEKYLTGVIYPRNLSKGKYCTRY